METEQTTEKSRVDKIETSIGEFKAEFKVSTDEIRNSIKEIAQSTQSQIKSFSDDIKALTSSLAKDKEAKETKESKESEESKVIEKEISKVIEQGKYRIEFGRGSLGGGSFTLVR